MRTWRVASNFHRVGDLIVTVQAPNWTAAIRKAALAIKKLPVMKGKRLNMGTFMLQEVEGALVSEQPSEQIPLQGAQVEQEQTPPATTSEPEK